MNYTEYKEKLRQFNSTDRYKKELKFLSHLLRGQNIRGKVLDYGCGLGTAIHFMTNNFPEFTTKGFDVTDYSDPALVNRTQIIDDSWYQFDAAYFMHSLAHIPDVKKVLSRFVSQHIKRNGKIIVITPNKSFIDSLKSVSTKNNYIPDPTVVEHFDVESLFILMESCNLTVETIGTFGDETASGSHLNRVFCVATYS